MNMNERMTKEEWAENTVDSMDWKALYRLAYDVMLDSVEDMSDKEFQEYLIYTGYEEVSDE
tara:strand:- start:703 stop:885 length:183 start_codon:yes stop_codon:yes gene_type:complete